MKKFFEKSTALFITLVLFIACVSIIQAGYVEPLQNPPPSGPNTDAPVNLDDDFQDMTGGLEADSIGVSYGISFPGSPPSGGSRTTVDGWPSGGTANCNLQVRRVDWTTGTRTFATDPELYLQQYPLCDDYLTTPAKDAGWASTGLDNCLGTTGADCTTMRPSTCIFTRLVCPSGITVVKPIVSTSTYIAFLGSPIDLPITSTTTNPL